MVRNAFDRLRRPGRAVALLAGAAIVVGSVVFLPGSGRSQEPGETEALTLNQAVAIALENNPDVQVAELNLEKARIAIREARDRASRLRDLPIETVDSVRGAQLGPLQAENEARVAEQRVAVARDGLRLRVEQAYGQALLAAEVVRVREQALEASREHLRQAKVGADAGVRAQSDVLRAEVDLAQREADLSTARKNEALALL
ncbi:MAG: TolC family protein, partial [Clostridia bacterium]|nr:TolC family protein [Clostridia bacterium]